MPAAATTGIRCRVMSPHHKHKRNIPKLFIGGIIMLNRIILMGRLTHDPELRKTQSGVSVCSFSIAVDRDYKAQNGEKETDFFDIVTWRATADFVITATYPTTAAIPAPMMGSRCLPDLPPISVTGRASCLCNYKLEGGRLPSLQRKE